MVGSCGFDFAKLILCCCGKGVILFLANTICRRLDCGVCNSIVQEIESPVQVIPEETGIDTELIIKVKTVDLQT